MTHSDSQRVSGWDTQTNVQPTSLKKVTVFHVYTVFLLVAVFMVKPFWGFLSATRSQNERSPGT